VDRWRDEFTAMARGLSGGSGWVLLVYLPRERRLVNQYALDHTQNLATGTPILALDMYEHAYHIDFGANAAAYIDATMRNVDWARVELRYLSATGEGERGAGMAAQQTDLPFVSVEAIRDRMAGGETLRVIDVRPAKYHELEKSTMAGATWRDPERVESGHASCRSRSRSWCTASTVFTSAAASQRHCARKASTRATSRAACPRGRPSAEEDERRRYGLITDPAQNLGVSLYSRRRSARSLSPGR